MALCSLSSFDDVSVVPSWCPSSVSVVPWQCLSSFRADKRCSRLSRILVALCNWSHWLVVSRWRFPAWHSNIEGVFLVGDTMHQVVGPRLIIRRGKIGIFFILEVMMGWGGVRWGLITSCCCIRIDVYSLGCVATSGVGCLLTEFKIRHATDATLVTCLHATVATLVARLHATVATLVTCLHATVATLVTCLHATVATLVTRLYTKVATLATCLHAMVAIVTCLRYGCYVGDTSARYGCYVGCTSARHGCYIVDLSARHGCYVGDTSATDAALV